MLFYSQSVSYCGKSKLAIIIIVKKESYIILHYRIFFQKENYSITIVYFSPGDCFDLMREIMFFFHSQVQTKYKLPTLNWIALKPNQVRGTIFNELDDDRLHNQIDFSDFEERFKIGMSGHVANGNSEIDGLQSFPSKRFKKPENVSLLEHTRLRNIGKNKSYLCVP